ncbi:MAG TPA: hypothetical protein VFP98_06180 [Candidatus Polarisedimenticolia bacterium]|nr:hypothetical protein [Candidatus Polarisedimenticolia bacterium]
MKLPRFIAGAAAFLIAAVLAGPAPARADKLVIFKNGKSLRVKSAVKDGKWLKCQFEDKNSMSVLADGVLSIEEAALGAREGEFRANQVAVGSGYTPRSSPVRPGAGGGQPAEISAQESADLAASIAEEQEARRLNPPNQTGRPGRRGRFGAVPQQPPIIQGLTPLNQTGTPFQSRQGRSLSNRGVAVNSAGVNLQPQQPQQPSDDEEE